MFHFFYIKYTDIFLISIKMQATEWFSVIIIDQNTEIAFRISMHYSWCIYYHSRYSFDDMESLKFIHCGDNVTFIFSYANCCIYFIFCFWHCEFLGLNDIPTHGGF